MTESPFLALEERLDLDYAEQVAPGAAGKFPFPHGIRCFEGGFRGVASRVIAEVGTS